MTNFELAAETREATGKKVKALRKSGRIPGVIYGKDVENQLIDVDTLTFKRVLAQAGTAGLLELTVGDAKPIHVLITDAQTDYLGAVQHIDFHKVKMDEIVRTAVPLKLIGEAPAVYNLGGSLVQMLEELEIEALPGDLPQTIEVDVSGLEELEAHLSVETLTIPDKVTVLTDAHEMICKVESPRSDEEMAALEEEMGEDAPAEVTEEGEESAEAEPEAN